MAFYESVFLARQEISQQQVDAVADHFANVISENGGQVTKREYWGLKSLAYRIKKSRKAHYTLFNIDAPSSAVQEMERQMQLNEDILRFMTITVDKLDEDPSVQARNKSLETDDEMGEEEFTARKPVKSDNEEEHGDTNSDNSVDGIKAPDDTSKKPEQSKIVQDGEDIEQENSTGDSEK